MGVPDNLITTKGYPGELGHNKACVVVKLEMFPEGDDSYVHSYHVKSPKDAGNVKIVNADADSMGEQPAAVAEVTEAARDQAAALSSSTSADNAASPSKDAQKASVAEDDL